MASDPSSTCLKWHPCTYIWRVEDCGRYKMLDKTNQSGDELHITPAQNIHALITHNVPGKLILRHNLQFLPACNMHVYAIDANPASFFKIYNYLYVGKLWYLLIRTLTHPYLWPDRQTWRQRSSTSAGDGTTSWPTGRDRIKGESIKMNAMCSHFHVWCSQSPSPHGLPDEHGSLLSHWDPKVKKSVVIKYKNVTCVVNKSTFYMYTTLVWHTKQCGAKFLTKYHTNTL